MDANGRRDIILSAALAVRASCEHLLATVDALLEEEGDDSASDEHEEGPEEKPEVPTRASPHYLGE